MKIALISPRGAFLSKNEELNSFLSALNPIKTYLEFSWSGFSPALLILASLTPQSHFVEVIDENFEEIDFEKDYELIGITAITQQATRAYAIADEFRKRGKLVVIGGIHATVMPEESKKHADAVIIGEAEELWPKFLDDIQRNKINSFYRANKLILFNAHNSVIPRYDLLKPEFYKKIWIQTSRGCPIDCEFCVSSKIYGSKIRHKSVGQVITEIEFIKKIWKNIIKVGFSDDNMFLDKKYSMELLNELRNLRIKWDAQSDVSIGDDKELLSLIKKCGCESIFVGFESVAHHNLAKIDKTSWKFKQFHKYKEIIQKIQSHGIGILGAFMIGFDKDDNDIFKKTIDFIIENNLAGAQITILTPLPGSRLRSRLESECRILDLPWDYYTGWDVTFIPKMMSIQELQKGLLYIYKEIYNLKTTIKRAKYFKEQYRVLLTKAKIE